VALLDVKLPNLQADRLLELAAHDDETLDALSIFA
jgi:hypothetical protein